MRLSWITRVGPKSKGGCPYSRREDSKKGHVERKAKIGGMWPLAKGHLEPPEEQGFPRASARSAALPTP